MPEAEGVISNPPADAVSGARHLRSAGATPASAEIYLYGRPIQVRLSRAAQTAAASLSAPLMVEMELYFSCLVRKAVRFRTANDVAVDSEHALITERLMLCFRPVTTEHCALPDDDAAPPLEAMPVKRPQAFLPRWLNIDFRRGEWRGEFGY